ncbi:unnamed protein product [Microthlaspi erraticum]|nr:unnamed protein product [Microthlaspi erraticum]
MVSGGVPRDIRTFNILLDGFRKNGMLEKALVIFQRLQKSQMEPDIFTYNIIIEGLCKACKVEDAWKLFCSLDLKGVMPDVVTYSILLDGFCRKGLKEEASALTHQRNEELRFCCR